MFYSPLRYPGGKHKLSAFIARICIDNDINGHYVEPYSGGASVALFLLLEGFVNKITINDRDRSIYAFWYSVLNRTNQLCELIEKTDITVEEWRIQKEIQKRKKTADLLELGFSTLFLNRTNRSGIINAGVIGGLKQDGQYLMDCRFNKIELIKRIKKIATRKQDIRLYKKDAIKLIEKIEKESQSSNVIFYFDPPYFLKANTLYMNHYKESDHQKVSKKIQQIKSIKWVVSYDNVEEIKTLYCNYEKKEYSFKHTAYKSREGQEVLFFSPELLQPKIPEWDPLKFYYSTSVETSKIMYKK
ncbi:DNA adenine methylase [Sulfurimonas sp.]|uniref:DNA adenine methylase n=1 Tax=Sulfurimonas sp. TaxID=2022749 RepID=UPI003D1257A6